MSIDLLLDNSLNYCHRIDIEVIVFKADIAPIVSCGLVTNPNVLVFESTDLNAPKLSIVDNDFRINSTKNLKSEWLDVRGEI